MGPGPVTRMRMALAFPIRMRRLLPIFLLLIPRAAQADFDHPKPGEVAARATPGTDGNWQEAHIVVDPPADAVRRWMTEFEYWPYRFRDMKSVRILSRNGDRARVWVKSEIMHELT